MNPNEEWKWLYNTCECKPLEEFACDYDRGFNQAMTFVRGWIKGKHPEVEE